MAIDLALLARGRLAYALPVAALDLASFARIAEGFGKHYLIEQPDSSRFTFERGEGLFRFEAFDAFSAIDGGSVKRILKTVAPAGENIISFAQPGWLRFDFRIRSAFAFIAFAVITLGLFVGGDPFLWFCLFIGLCVVQIVAVQRSIRRKVENWAPRPTLH